MNNALRALYLAAARSAALLAAQRFLTASLILLMPSGLMRRLVGVAPAGAEAGAIITSKSGRRAAAASSALQDN